jgi:hypothetical protein
MNSFSSLPPRAGKDSTSPTSVGEEAISLFAFVDPAEIAKQQLTDHAKEQHLALHCVGSIAAIVGAVPLADFCGLEAERNLGDVAWLTPRVRRHAELLEWAMQSSPVFPVPFGTLYTSLDSLTAFMKAHESTIVGFLRAATNKQEWELRAAVRLDSPEILDQLARKAWPEWGELPKGSRYMRLCRDKRLLLDFGCAEAAVIADDLVGKLEPLTSGVRKRHAAGTEFVARYALLVVKTNVAALRQSLNEAASGQGAEFVTFSLSGPLPPFSFRPDLNKPPGS